MLYGGYHLRPWEVGRLTAGEIEDMVTCEHAYARNMASLGAYFGRITRPARE